MQMYQTFMIMLTWSQRVFVDLGNTKIELMQPYGENSPLRIF